MKVIIYFAYLDKGDPAAVKAFRKLNGGKIGACRTRTEALERIHDINKGQPYRLNKCVEVTYDNLDTIKWNMLEQLYQRQFESRRVRELGKPKTEWFRISKKDFMKFAESTKPAFIKNNVQIEENEVTD